MWGNQELRIWCPTWNFLQGAELKAEAGPHLSCWGRKILARLASPAGSFGTQGEREKLGEQVGMETQIEFFFILFSSCYIMRKRLSVDKNNPAEESREETSNCFSLWKPLSLQPKSSEPGGFGEFCEEVRLSPTPQDSVLST